MVAALRRVLRTSCYENFTVIGLNGAEADRYVEVDVEQLARLLILVNVVVVYCSLVKLEVMDPVESVPHSLILLV